MRVATWIGKCELYKQDGDGRVELAKDVAALANSTGGLLVLCVAESSGKAAEELTPVHCLNLNGEYAGCTSRPDPPVLTGVDIWPISTEQDADKGYYMISVPHSADAPHLNQHSIKAVVGW